MQSDVVEPSELCCENLWGCSDEVSVVERGLLTSVGKNVRHTRAVGGENMKRGREEKTRNNREGGHEDKREGFAKMVDVG